MEPPLGILQRLRQLVRRRRDLFNIEIEPAYAIKASAENPYFQALEHAARQAGYLGHFVVDDQKRLRPGTNPALETRHARLTLDAYPNPAGIEGRTVADYDDPAAPRRTPRVTIVLDDAAELFLRARRGGIHVEEPPPRFRR